MAIFLSYRRDDSGVVTGRLAGDLKDAFGASQVYRDIDSIPPGKDFTRHIQDALSRCDLCVAIVGSEWATPRLFEKDDLLRKELEVVLERGVPLFPLLVDGASLPDATKVPPSLAALRALQLLRLDSGNDYELHLGRLVKAIRKERGWWREWRRLLAPVGGVAAVGLTVALWPRAGGGHTSELVAGAWGVGDAATVTGGRATAGASGVAGAASIGGTGAESGGAGGRDDARAGYVGTSGKSGSATETKTCKNRPYWEGKGPTQTMVYLACDCPGKELQRSKLGRNVLTSDLGKTRYLLEQLADRPLPEGWRCAR